MGPSLSAMIEVNKVSSKEEGENDVIRRRRLVIFKPGSLRDVTRDIAGSFGGIEDRLHRDRVRSVARERIRAGEGEENREKTSNLEGVSKM